MTFFNNNRLSILVHWCLCNKYYLSLNVKSYRTLIAMSQISLHMYNGPIDLFIVMHYFISYVNILLPCVWIILTTFYFENNKQHKKIAENMLLKIDKPYLKNNFHFKNCYVK